MHFSFLYATLSRTSSDFENLCAQINYMNDQSPEHNNKSGAKEL